MNFELPAIFSSFSRKEGLRIKYGGAAILVIGGLLYWKVGDMKVKYDAINAEIVATPEVKADESTGKMFTKAEALILEKKLAKYRKIKTTLEGFIPREGNKGKPAIISINDIVQNIPAAIDVDRSEKSEDTPMVFSEQILTGFIDIKNPKPVYRFQSLAYTFTFRSTYTALVYFFKAMDQLGTFYFVRDVAIHPLVDRDPLTAKDPKFAVELTIQTIYLLKNQVKN